MRGGAGGVQSEKLLKMCKKSKCAFALFLRNSSVFVENYDKILRVFFLKKNNMCATKLFELVKSDPTSTCDRYPPHTSSRRRVT